MTSVSAGHIILTPTQPVGQKVPMAILSNEVFPQKVEVSQNYPIYLRSVLNERCEHAAFHGINNSNYPGVPFAPSRGDASHMSSKTTRFPID